MRKKLEELIKRVKRYNARLKNRVCTTAVKARSKKSQKGGRGRRWKNVGEIRLVVLKNYKGGNKGQPRQRDRKRVSLYRDHYA